MSPESFERGMSRLADVWPEQDISDERALAYFEILRELPDDVWMEAVRVTMSRATFFPKPAEILHAADELLARVGVLPPSADDAWATIIAAARTWYPGLVQPPLHPMVQQVLRPIGGIRKVALASDREAGFIERDFRKQYNAQRDVAIDFDGLRAKGVALALEAARQTEHQPPFNVFDNDGLRGTSSALLPSLDGGERRAGQGDRGGNHE